jgi:hypothetical protein
MLFFADKYTYVHELLINVTDSSQLLIVGLIARNKGIVIYIERERRYGINKTATYLVIKGYFST